MDEELKNRNFNLPFFKYIAEECSGIQSCTESNFNDIDKYSVLSNFREICKIILYDIYNCIDVNMTFFHDNNKMNARIIILSKQKEINLKYLDEDIYILLKKELKDILERKRKKICVYSSFNDNNFPNRWIHSVINLISFEGVELSFIFKEKFNHIFVLMEIAEDIKISHDIISEYVSVQIRLMLSKMWEDGYIRGVESYLLGWNCERVIPGDSLDVFKPKWKDNRLMKPLPIFLLSLSPEKNFNYVNYEIHGSKLNKHLISYFLYNDLENEDRFGYETYKGDILFGSNYIRISIKNYKELENLRDIVEKSEYIHNVIIQNSKYNDASYSFISLNSDSSEKIEKIKNYILENISNYKEENKFIGDERKIKLYNSDIKLLEDNKIFFDGLNNEIFDIPVIHIDTTNKKKYNISIITDKNVKINILKADINKLLS